MNHKRKAKINRIIRPTVVVSGFVFTIMFATGLVLYIKSFFAPLTMLIIGAIGLILMTIFGLVSKKELKRRTLWK